MPADPSSPIPSGLDPLRDADPLQETGGTSPPHLLAYPATIADPRAPRGRRHPLVAILAVAAAAVLVGARSMTAIAEWAADAPQPVRAAIGAWLANRDDQTRHGRAIAVDGKTLRGARTPDRRQVHLLATMDHTTRCVLAQRQADGAPAEIPAFQPRWPTWDLAGVVVTADALQSHADAAEFLVTRKRATTCSSSRPTSPPLLDRWTAGPLGRWAAGPL